MITEEVVQQLHLNSPDFTKVRIGLLHLLLQHTSASLTINENADPAVRQDFETFFNHIAPDLAPTQTQYHHHDEGPDDLPAHFKASILGQSLILPIKHGKLALGTWQGIYLGEHRQHAQSRCIIATTQGQV